MHSIDIYIGKQIKRFAHRYTPPANGRLRLMRAVSSNDSINAPKPERQPYIGKNTYENRQATDWSFRSAEFSILYYFRLDALMMHHVL
jgi:hypothetical protein